MFCPYAYMYDEARAPRNVTGVRTRDGCYGRRNEAYLVRLVSLRGTEPLTHHFALLMDILSVWCSVHVGSITLFPVTYPVHMQRHRSRQRSRPWQARELVTKSLTRVKPFRESYDSVALQSYLQELCGWPLFGLSIDNWPPDLPVPWEGRWRWRRQLGTVSIVV